jgi:tryptophan halogenase
MKIAVIGGGTAGYIAAAHITKYFPQFELYHIYDSRIPTIGVGEGTTLYFPKWLNAITGLSYSELEEKCHVTRKFGISFDNWGFEYQQFMHHFYPVGQAYGYHISAAKIVELLQDYVSATNLDKQVIGVKSDGVAVDITFEDDTHLEVDLAIDARGFPKSLDRDRVKLSWIPTNAALIRQAPVADRGLIQVKVGDRVLKYQSVTRSVSRPHGWIFVIPLTSRTSYGYIYNSDLNSVSDIENDLDEFLHSEGITCFPGARQLNFPNFTERTFFDGALFKIGNTASFLEPLEATAIGCILKQVEILSYWPLRQFAKQEKRGRLNEDDLKMVNRYLLNYVYKMSLFVGWHYAKGSCFKTKFWQFAQTNFYQEIKNLENQELLKEFESYLQAGADIVHPIQNFLKFSQTVAQKPANSPLLPEPIPKAFAQWQTPSFTEVGYGIGYFS